MTRLTDALERARRGASQPDVEEGATETTTQVTTDAGLANESHAPSTSSAKTNRFNLDTPAGELEQNHDVTRNRLAGVEYHFARDAEEKLVVGPSSDHTVVEQHRHLAAALHHAQLKNAIRTVMVTSAVEAEGKTTTAANMALTLSHSHQRRVLLIDADLRRPSLHMLFQVANRDGLGDYLRDFTPDRKKPAIHRISPLLSLLTAGRPTQDPMSALVSDEMRQIIQDAAEHFDWVVVDTPPVALLSDANLLAAMIDVAVLVVRANATAYPLVQRAQEAIGAGRILGVVLNRAKQADLAVGYGYYYYGYSYKPSNTPEKRGLMRLFRRT